MDIKRLKEIESRKAEILALLEGEGQVNIDELETELRNLTAEKGEIEKRERLVEELRTTRQVRTPVTDPEKDRAEWRSLGDFVQAVVFNPGDKRLRGREVEGRSQTMDGGLPPGSEGGFLVPEQFSQELLTVSPDEAIVRPRATVFPGGSDANFYIPAIQYSGNNMFGGAQVNWIAEGAAKPETDVQFKQITLHPFEVAAHVRVTDKLLRNAPAIEQIVKTQLRNALIDAEEAAFLTGAGGVQPTGIIGHPSNVVVPRAAPGDVVYQDLADMYARFRGRRGVWIVSRTVLPALMALVDPNGNFVWQPNARDGTPGTIFGMPVMFSENSPALGVEGDVLLADLSYYLIRDGVGVALAMSPHVEFVNNVTYIKAFKTVDGIPWLAGPLPTNPATSPFVVLDV